MYAAELRVRACEAGIRLHDYQDCGLLALQLLRWLHALPCIDPHRESCYRNLMTTSGSSHFTAAIVGGGPVGLAAAIGFAHIFVPTALVARKTVYGDNRTTALLGGSIDFLTSLQVWPRCEQQAAALRELRLIDDTGRLERAPEVRLSAEEIGEQTFGYNIENRVLVAALEARAAELPNLVRYDDDASTIQGSDTSADIETASGTHLRAATGRTLLRCPAHDAAGRGIPARALRRRPRHARPAPGPFDPRQDARGG